MSYLKGYRRYHSYSNNDDFSKLKILTPLKVTIVTKVTDITDIFSSCHNRYVRDFWKVTKVTIVTEITRFLKTCDDYYFNGWHRIESPKVIDITKVTNITRLYDE